MEPTPPAVEVQSLFFFFFSKKVSWRIGLYLFIYYLLIYLFIHFYLWLHWVFVAALGLFSSCGERGLLFVVVCRLFTVVASLVVEYRL